MNLMTFKSNVSNRNENCIKDISYVMIFSVEVIVLMLVTVPQKNTDGSLSVHLLIAEVEKI